MASLLRCLRGVAAAATSPLSAAASTLGSPPWAPDLLLLQRRPLLLAAAWHQSFLSPSCSNPSTHLDRRFASDAATTSAQPQQTGSAAADGSGSPPLVAKPHLVEKFLGLELLSQTERFRHKRMDVIRDFQRHQGDVGSPQVKVALWTEQIRDKAKGLQSHRKNYHQLRKLELLFHQRRRMLGYLREKDFDTYCFTIHKLGLKDMYGRVRAEDRYPIGSVHGQPVDDHVVRYRFAFHKQFRQKKTNLWKRLTPKLMYEDPSLDLKM